MTFCLKKLISLVSITATVSAACNTVSTRQEIRDLSASERANYFSAVKKLHSDSDIFSRFSSQHYSNVAEAHGVPAFLPWHRRFIYQYEQELQKIDPSVVLPYWDWSRDSQAPELSAIFSDSYLGGNGAPGSYCVTTGTFANWQATVPNRHCLKRQFSGGRTIPSFYSPEALEAIISQSTSFDSLRTSIEGGPHGAVHVGIGGDNGDFSAMYSSNDPIFYLHHAFVDLLWSEWQARNPSKAETYGGSNAKPTDNMVPFNVQVESTFDTSELCYKYNRFGTKMPRSMNRRDLGLDLEGELGQGLLSKHSQLSSFVGSVSSSISSTLSHIKLSANDRTTRHKIRVPQPLPDRYIKNNNLVLSEVRLTENLLANLTMALNSIVDFIPAAVLPNL